MQKKISAILLLATVIVLSSIGLEAQTYRLERYVFGSGGVVDALTTGYRMNGIVGQLAIDNYTSAAGNYAVQQGFWVSFVVTDVPEEVKHDNSMYNYPNPFNQQTTIQYELAGTAVVTLRIYDMMGNVVKTLIQGSVQDGGIQSIMWDGRNESGLDVGSGSYVYELVANPAQLAGAPTFEAFTIRNVMILVR
jgi:hypothetical protein